MIHIATATDRAYLPWCATLIRSCLDHHGSSLAVYVLHERVSIDELDPLVEMVRAEGATIRLISGPPSIEVLPPYIPFGRTHLLRLVLPEMLPALSRLVYLDADTFAAGPLDDLWTTSLEGCPVAAVRNVVEPRMRQHVRTLIGDDAGFFNAGVLLIDMDAVRKDGSFERVLENVSAVPPSPWSPDQDALNIEFAGRWKPLHPRWNAMNSLWTWGHWARDFFDERAWTEAMTDPAVLHFEGPALCKPWHYLCEHPWVGRYREALERTPWRDAAPMERTLATRLIARLPVAWRAPAYWRWRIWRDRLDSRRTPVDAAQA